MPSTECIVAVALSKADTEMPLLALFNLEVTQGGYARASQARARDILCVTWLRSWCVCILASTVIGISFEDRTFDLGIFSMRKY